jgi:hypothetical protein
MAMDRDRKDREIIFKELKVDSDWKDQEAKIDAEREMKKSLLQEMLAANAIMTLREHLQDKSKEYKDGWWAGWHFSADYYNENDEICRNTWKEYFEKWDKIRLQKRKNN